MTPLPRGVTEAQWQGLSPARRKFIRSEEAQGVRWGWTRWFTTYYDNMVARAIEAAGEKP